MISNIREITAMENYQVAINKLEAYLSTHTIWVVATGDNEGITASSMSILSFNDRIYFQTDERFEKYKYLTKNPQIALCNGNYQIKGLAKSLGPTTSEANADIIQAYREVHPNSFKMYSEKKESVLIEIEPQKVICWDYIKSQPCLSFIDISCSSYNQKLYE